MRNLVKMVLPRVLHRFVRSSIDTVRARVRWARIRIPRRPRGIRSTERDDGLRLALLAMRFPPEIGGGTYRPASLASYAAKAGLNVTVIAGHARQRLTDAGAYLASLVPSNVVVHRARPEGQFAFSGLLPTLAGGLLELLNLYDAADQAFLSWNPDVILATGPQFYTFVAGQRLAARYGCPLVLDYRDEWTECPFDFVQSGELDRKWEKRCLAAAEHVIFTTESQQAHALESFPELEADRCTVLPNGWEPHDWIGLPAYHEGRTPDGPLVVSFVGNLGNHTPPDEFLTELETCLDGRPDLRDGLRFRFVGTKSPEAAEQLASYPWPEMIESIDQVTKSEAGRLMRESAALLLLNPPSLHRYIPGKLYEYMAAGPPILVHGAGGEVESLIERLGAGTVLAASDSDALAAALERICTGSAGSTFDRTSWLTEHTREAIARRMIALVRSAVEARDVQE